jgi:hypothetical protein
MRIAGELNYRNAKAVIQSAAPGILEEIVGILTDPLCELDFSVKGKQRNLSKQVQDWFVQHGWAKEAPSFSIPDMRYDLLKNRIPVEIELGHQRLVFPDFFEFLADFSKGEIPCGVMVVTGDPHLFGHDWHCSLDSTSRKIDAIREVFLVPLLVLAVNP